jgi:hypothetical protein
MDSYKLWARNGAAMRQAIELVQTGQKADRSQPRRGSLRSPVWQSTCASAPHAGLSSRPSMQQRPQPAHTRAPSTGWAGATSMVGCRCLQDACRGHGRRLPSLDTTQVAVPFEIGTYE